MAAVIYLHGFLSSPQSRKCMQAQEWFAAHYPATTFCAPKLSSYPGEAKATLLDLVASLGDQPKYAIGSSLGGFWATYLVENHGVDKAVLVNPAVLPHTRFQEYIGRELKSYYTEETFTLSESDIAELQCCDVQTIVKHEQYWLFVQTGDETLDYRLAVEKYTQCRQHVEAGGNHSYQGFERHFADIATYFGGLT